MKKEYRILLAVDLRAGTERLVAEAERFGRALDAVVDILHIVPPDPDFVGYIKAPPGQEQREVDIERDLIARDRVNERCDTEDVGASLRAKGIRVGQVLMLQDAVIDAVLAEVGKLQSDLLMLGGHHHGALYRMWYGDTAVDAVKQAPCAVLVVPT